MSVCLADGIPHTVRVSASETQRKVVKKNTLDKYKMAMSMAIWLLLCVSVVLQSVCGATSANATASTVTTSDNDAAIDLDKAESKDSKTAEIIKQIRRVNSDGSYTVGYETDDGSFKIESRDVLGNIKGTYGFVDQNGEIKRVSYTANNDTNLLKSTMAPTEEVVHIPRQNRTQFTASTTRRPSALTYLATSTMTPSRSNTAKTLPKRRILLSAADRGTRKSTPQYSTMVRKSEFTATTNRKTEPTTTIVYATSVPHTKMSRMTTQMSPSSTTPKPETSKKPEKIEISDRFSKVLNMKERTSSEKPVFESSDEKETQTERKPLRGNYLRRQLPDGSNEHFEAQQQVVYSSQSSAEVGGHVYGGITGSVRPIFSTTSSPRIPALVLAARSRAALLKSSQQQPATQTTSTTERVYAKPPRRKVERQDGEQTTEPTSENNYLTQSPVSVQIPANPDVSQASEDDQRVYRRPNNYLPRSREYLRQAQQDNSIEPGGPRQYRIPIQPTANLPNDYENDQQQYLRETSNPPQNDQYANPEANSVHPTAFGARNARPQLPQPTAQGAYDPQQQQQSYPLPNPYAPYPRQPVPYGPNYYSNPDRPLTARDFERLLNLLVVRHQQYQRYNYLGGSGPINPYAFGGGGGPFNGYSPFGGFGGFPGYQGYQQQIPRPPLYNQFDPRYGGYRPPVGPPPPGGGYAPYTEQENMYQAQNPIPEQQQPYSGQRLPRARPYVPNYFGQFGDRTEYGDESQQSYQQANGEYLPSNVREELLYRMLMLAIQPDQNMIAPVPEASTMQEYVKTSATTAAPARNSKKPVRSVQILGEDEE